MVSSSTRGAAAHHHTHHHTLGGQRGDFDTPRRMRQKRARPARERASGGSSPDPPRAEHPPRLQDDAAAGGGGAEVLLLPRDVGAVAGDAAAGGARLPSKVPRSLTRAAHQSPPSGGTKRKKPKKKRRVAPEPAPAQELEEEEEDDDDEEARAEERGEEVSAREVENKDDSEELQDRYGVDVPNIHGAPPADVREGTHAAGATAVTTGEEVEPVPYSALAALDEGMMRNVKANRKRGKEAQTLLKRAAKLKEIKFFNRIIKDFGNDKQMGFAEEAFKRISGAGLTPTVYSFTNLLNACVRVGELDRARKVWSDMLASGVEPNEVTYTVLLKGLAQEGLLSEAMCELETMSDKGVYPNVRTFSTLLRNCVRHANPAAADRCFEAMRAADVAPDVASFEYLVKARCAAMDAEGAWKALDEMEGEGLAVPPQAYAALATVSSLTGDVGRARRACKDARAAVEENGAGTVDAEDEGQGGDGGLFGSFAGGSRAYESDIDDDDNDNGGGGGEGRGVGGRQGRHGEVKGQPGKGGSGKRHQQQQSGEASKSVQQFLRLRNSDALREVAEVEAFLSRGEAFVAEVSEHVKRGPHSDSSPVLIVESSRRSGGEGERLAEAPLNFAEVFGNTLPVRMEVCSGHGDWVTARAETDAGRGNWLAIEMRRNRVRLTWAKALRKRLTNIALLCGMAHEMIGAHVPAHSLAEIHVNYPDPPEWVGSSQCLVDQPFLRAAHRSLRKRGAARDGGTAGHLTLVTDDPTYAMRMCRELSRVPHLFRPTETGGRPFRTGVPDGYGGSYFDEMWKNGNLRDRYYMRYSAL